MSTPIPEKKINCLFFLFLFIISTIFDLIQAEEENETAITELDGMLDKYYDEEDTGNADP